MAERRMFAKTIVDSDAFLDMPASSQALYFHLSMRADDDGFINNPRRIQRMVGASDDDLRLLIAKRFVLIFESGVIVIKHWRINNYIRNDRYKETLYQEEKDQLIISETNAYTEKNKVGIPSGIPSDNQAVDKRYTQDRLGKDSIGKVRIDTSTYIDSNNIVDGSTYQDLNLTRDIKRTYGKFQNVRLTDEEIKKLQTLYPDWETKIDALSIYIKQMGKDYKDHYLTICLWAEKDEKKKKSNQTNSKEGSFDTDEFFEAAKARR